jgi:hypothetical protein
MLSQEHMPISFSLYPVCRAPPLNHRHVTSWKWKIAVFVIGVLSRFETVLHDRSLIVLVL